MVLSVSSTDKLRAALDYHEMGLCIVPIVKGKKVPPWGFPLKRHFSRRPTTDDLNLWFGRRRWDMAVALGKVSDCLCHRDFDGMASYDDWASAYPGLAASLPTSATGRAGGGRHVFFTADLNEIRERTRNKRTATLLLPDGGHLKGHGIAVLPPSTHSTGVEYRWLVPPTDFPYVSDLEAAGLLPPDLSGGVNTRDFFLPAPSYKGAEEANLDPEQFIGTESPVEWAIQTSLPTDEGQRHLKLFEFTRKLQSIPDFQDADPNRLFDQVFAWHNAAKPFIRTKEFEETWKDFINGWNEVQRPFGTTLAAAEMRVQGQGIARLEDLCRELQALWGDRPFFIGTRLAGNLLGVSHVIAAKWIKRLVRQGKLQLVEEGRFKSRRASTYRYVA